MFSSRIIEGWRESKRFQYVGRYLGKKNPDPDKLFLNPPIFETKALRLFALFNGAPSRQVHTGHLLSL